MLLAAFLAQHGPALEQDEVRHNLILGVLGAAAATPGAAPTATWTLGGPGECAIATPGRPMILGALEREQCRRLAELTHADGYTGVVGVDRTTDWFVERAAELGAPFAEPIRQRVHVIREPPKYPEASGHARSVDAVDVPRVADYLEAFRREALPHDPAPLRPALEKPKERLAAPGSASESVETAVLASAPLLVDESLEMLGLLELLCTVPAANVRRDDVVAIGRDDRHGLPTQETPEGPGLAPWAFSFLAGAPSTPPRIRRPRSSLVNGERA